MYAYCCLSQQCPENAYARLQVMDMLRHCPLSIEDVLPDFPDEVQINEFKVVQSI